MERDIVGDEMEITELEILRDIRMDDRSIREDLVCQTDPTTCKKATVGGISHSSS